MNDFGIIDVISRIGINEKLQREWREKHNVEMVTKNLNGRQRDVYTAKQISDLMAWAGMAIVSIGRKKYVVKKVREL